MYPTFAGSSCLGTEGGHAAAAARGRITEPTHGCQGKAAVQTAALSRSLGLNILLLGFNSRVLAGR